MYKLKQECSEKEDDENPTWIPEDHWWTREIDSLLDQELHPEHKEEEPQQEEYLQQARAVVQSIVHPATAIAIKQEDFDDTATEATTTTDPLRAGIPQEWRTTTKRKAEFKYTDLAKSVRMTEEQRSPAKKGGDKKITIGLEELHGRNFPYGVQGQVEKYITTTQALETYVRVNFSRDMYTLINEKSGGSAPRTKDTWERCYPRRDEMI